LTFAKDEQLMDWKNSFVRSHCFCHRSRLVCAA